METCVMDVAPGMNAPLCVSDVPCSLDQVVRDGMDYDVTPYYLVTHQLPPHKIEIPPDAEKVYTVYLPLMRGLDLGVLRAWLKENMSDTYELFTRFQWQCLAHRTVREFVGLTIAVNNHMDFVLLKMYWVPDDSGYRPHGG